MKQKKKKRSLKLYRCDWFDGSVAIVLAENKSDAVDRLDEIGYASHERLTELDEFLIDISINEDQVRKARDEMELATTDDERDRIAAEAYGDGTPKFVDVVFGEGTLDVLPLVFLGRAIEIVNDRDVVEATQGDQPS